MARQIKEFVQIDTVSTLDDLIAALAAVRKGLPEGAEPELLLRGCDVFGRHIAITYMRPQTAEEEAREAHYANAVKEMLARQDRERADEGKRGYGTSRAA